MIGGHIQRHAAEQLPPAPAPGGGEAEFQRAVVQHAGDPDGGQHQGPVGQGKGPDQRQGDAIGRFEIRLLDLRQLRRDRARVHAVGDQDNDGRHRDDDDHGDGGDKSADRPGHGAQNKAPPAVGAAAQIGQQRRLVDAKGAPDLRCLTDHAPPV